MCAPPRTRAVRQFKTTLHFETTKQPAFAAQIASNRSWRWMVIRRSRRPLPRSWPSGRDFYEVAVCHRLRSGYTVLQSTLRPPLHPTCLRGCIVLYWTVVHVRTHACARTRAVRQFKTTLHFETTKQPGFAAQIASNRSWRWMVIWRSQVNQC